MFDEFHYKLKDIVNFAFNLRETIPKSKVVRKVLRSLLERFHAKITVIEELEDIDKIHLIELVGNLQTYELGLTRIRKSCQDRGKKDAKESGQYIVPSVPKCFRCQDFGHMKQECPTYLISQDYWKKQGPYCYLE